MTMLDKAEDTLVDDDSVDLADLFHIPGNSEADTQDVRLGFLIHDVSRLRRNAFDQLMRPLGVTRSQWWVVAHLSRRDGMMQTDLATMLDVGKVTLGGLIDRLEAGGWVERRADSEDRRVKRIFLTETAYDLIRDMRALEHQHNSRFLKGFSHGERTLLTEMLSRIKRNLAT